MVSADGAVPRAARTPLTGIAEQPGPRVPGVLPVLGQLILHFACFVSNICTLAIFAFFHEWDFFGALSLVWLLAGVFCAWAALKEMQPLSCCPDCRRWGCWVWVAVVFGLLRGVQVRHICRCCRSRHGTESNSKTFDGILEGFFFALGNQYAFLMLDMHPYYCPWYITRRFTHDGRVQPFQWLCFLFLFSTLCSILQLTAGIVAVDHRVSTTAARRRISGSAWMAAPHFLYRASYVISRISLFSLLCIFLRPQQWMHNSLGPFLLYLPTGCAWLVYIIILYRQGTQGVESESLLAHAAVALAAITVIPTQFVDRPVYVPAAKRTSRAILYAHGIELALVVAFVVWAWRTDLSAVCSPGPKPPANRPTTIGLYSIWRRSNHWIVYVELGLALACLAFLLLREPYLRGALRDSRSGAVPGQPLRDTSNASIWNFQVDEARGPLQAEMRSRVPRGLSSFLVQVGTGVTSRLFVNMEYALTDFVIEKVLGRGGCGVVVLVTAMWWGGRPLPEDKRRRYALKLQTVQGEWQDTYAERERQYLMKLSEDKHPLIIHLRRFFDVPPAREFWDVEGKLIQNRNGNSHFNKALLMDYCPQGDLHGFLERKALVATSFNAPPSPDAETVEQGLAWLQDARRLSAEALEAVRFLHGLDLMHRDLKPGNILLKTGADGLLHACVADFGFAKLLVEGTLPMTVVGTPEYMAPEILKMWFAGQSVGDPYTKHADLWSLGKLIKVLLWGAKYKHGQDWLFQVAERSWFEGLEDPTRMPASAWELVGQMMQEDPDERGTAKGLCGHAFFGDLRHRGRHLPAVDWHALRQEAPSQGSFWHSH